MKVKRIIPNLTAANPADAAEFYEAIFELKPVSDHGWSRTFGSVDETTAQINVASEGGSGTPVPDLTIEVDDLDTVVERIEAAGLGIEYGPVDEPWGVRRLYVSDPFGMLINVLQTL